MINHQYRFISVNIPRTASSARARAFTNMPLGQYTEQDAASFWQAVSKHAPITTYARKYPLAFLTYFKFTFVRNPYERIVSFWNYRTYKQGYNGTFENYVLHDPFGDMQRQQLDYISVLNGRLILVDYIARFENIDEEWQYICERIGFPHQPLPAKSAMAANYQQHYTPLIRQAVEVAFKDTIQQFDYVF